jgi:hypothetical protein
MKPREGCRMVARGINCQRQMIPLAQFLNHVIDLTSTLAARTSIADVDS